MSTTNDLFTELSDMVLSRFHANREKSMVDVYKINLDFIHLEKESLFYLFSNREKFLKIFNDPDLFNNLVELFVNNTLEFTYKNNQYINLNQFEIDRLKKIYQTYLESMKRVLNSGSDFATFSSDFANLMKEHFQLLRRNISRFFDSNIGMQFQENIILQQVVCSEYSPEFQLEILGLDTNSILEPVLDIGCGKKGTLVNYLQGRGINATGIDRIVEKNPFLKRGDWLDLQSVPETWGTVISHMAFSNHFIFNHKYLNGSPNTYAKIYMKILESLKTGGKFIYTPELPFIERFLPDTSFRIEKYRNPMPLQNPGNINTHIGLFPTVSIVNKLR